MNRAALVRDLRNLNKDGSRIAGKRIPLHYIRIFLDALFVGRGFTYSERLVFEMLNYYGIRSISTEFGYEVLNDLSELRQMRFDRV